MAIIYHNCKNFFKNKNQQIKVPPIYTLPTLCISPADTLADNPVL